MERRGMLLLLLILLLFFWAAPNPVVAVSEEWIAWLWYCCCCCRSVVLLFLWLWTVVFEFEKELIVRLVFFVTCAWTVLSFLALCRILLAAVPVIGFRNNALVQLMAWLCFRLGRLFSILDVFCCVVSKRCYVCNCTTFSLVLYCSLSSVLVGWSIWECVCLLSASKWKKKLVFFLLHYSSAVICARCETISVEQRESQKNIITSIIFFFLKKLKNSQKANAENECPGNGNVGEKRPF